MSAVDASSLMLEAPSEWRQLARKLAVLLVPVVFIVWLAAASAHAEDWGGRGLAWSLIAALGVVTVLGLLSVVRQARRVFRGVHFGVHDGRVEGFLEARGGLADYTHGAVSVPLSDLEAVLLERFELDAGPQRLRLVCALRGGRRIAGPEAVAGDDAPRVASQLRGVADALAERARAPVRAFS